jgi:hypothetical protein
MGQKTSQYRPPIEKVDISQLFVEYIGADKEQETKHAVVTLANKLNEVIDRLNMP